MLSAAPRLLVFLHYFLPLPRRVRSFCSTPRRCWSASVTIVGRCWRCLPTLAATMRSAALSFLGAAAHLGRLVQAELTDTPTVDNYVRRFSASGLSAALKRMRRGLMQH